MSHVGTLLPLAPLTGCGGNPERPAANALAPPHEGQPSGDGRGWFHVLDTENHRVQRINSRDDITP